MEKLTTEEELELLTWIDSFELSRPSRKLCRDFSDAVLTAEILKAIFPKWVDLHNYQPCNSVSQKVDNWFTLNRKVLKKMDLSIDQSTMEGLAQADLDVIERFLFTVMKRSVAILEEKTLREEESRQCSDTKEIMMVEVQQKVGEKVKVVQQKMILYSLYQELQKTVNDKNQVILILSQKNNHLEGLMKLKDQRIRDLEEKVQKSSKNPQDWLSLD